MDLCLTGSLLPAEGACLNMVGPVTDADGDMLLEALLLFRRVLVCPTRDDLWTECLLLPPVDRVVRRLGSKPPVPSFSAICVCECDRSRLLQVLALAPAH